MNIYVCKCLFVFDNVSVFCDYVNMLLFVCVGEYWNVSVILNV